MALIVVAAAAASALASFFSGSVFATGLSGDPTAAPPEADEAERVLKIAIDWGRYGEVYGYSYNSGMLTLPELEGAAPDGTQPPAREG